MSLSKAGHFHMLTASWDREQGMRMCMSLETVVVVHRQGTHIIFCYIRNIFYPRTACIKGIVHLVRRK